MVQVEEVVDTPPNPKRRKVDTIAISLPGQRLQFEEERRECTYCAFFTDLKDGVATIVEKAKKVMARK